MASVPSESAKVHERLNSTERSNAYLLARYAADFGVADTNDILALGMAYLRLTDEADELRSASGAKQDDNAIVFPNAVMKCATEGALARDRERQETWQRVKALLRLDSGSHLNHVLEMGDDSFVAEVMGGPFTDADRPSTWRVIVDGDRCSECFASLDMALLRFVELRHNGNNPNGRGFEFAARAFGIKEG